METVRSAAPDPRAASPARSARPRRARAPDAAPRTRARRWTLRKEFMFLISTLVPELGGGRARRNEMLASQRSEPSSMFPSQTPRKTRMARSAPEVGGGLLGRAQVRPRDDLHQRHAGAVVVDLARARGVETSPSWSSLPTSSSRCRRSIADAPRHAAQLDLQRAVLGQRLLVLADLVVLRHVRVVVVLPREPVLQR